MQLFIASHGTQLEIRNPLIIFYIWFEYADNAVVSHVSRMYTYKDTTIGYPECIL